MSLTVHISLDGLLKKVICPKSSSVGQLARESLVKFELDPDLYPMVAITPMTSNKKLDGLLPLRLSNIVNNAKLRLVLGPKHSGSTQITVKLVANLIDKTSSTLVLKIANDITISQFIDTVVDAGVNLRNYEYALHHLVLNILNNKINLSTLNLDPKISNFVGNSSSVVIRADYIAVDNQQHQLEQERIVKLQLEHQKKQLESTRLNNVHASEKIPEVVSDNSDNIRPSSEISSQSSSISSLNPENIMRGTRTNASNADFNASNLSPLTSPHSRLSPQQQLSEDSPALKSDDKPTFQQHTISSDPTLFKSSENSSGKSKIYENPDEDYEITLSQAQQYQRLISNSAKNVRKQAKTTFSSPELYAIRIKFPNLSMLQIFFENGPAVKFGSILRRIDELLVEKYINNYNLKLGYPPFKKLDMSFNNNNKLLNSFEGFNSNGKITLIWESTLEEFNKSGPFLKEDQISIKYSDQLPEVQLESHRGELDDGDDDLSASKRPPSATNSNNKDQNGKKFPKWFRTK